MAETPEKSAFILTYGCQMNVHDSEIMQGYLQNMGYRPAAQASDADLVLVNTCCVRDSAEKKVYGKLGELKGLKEHKPDLVLAVAGCMTQQPEVADKLKQRAPYLDLIIGTHALHQLPDLVRQVTAERELLVHVEPEGQEMPAEFPVARQGQVAAWVTIMQGCDNFCTFCIVPYVRGREISRPIEEIHHEVASLAARGFKEVTLLGQNVNAYGGDLPDRPSFRALLAALEDVSGLERIRYTSPHPAEFDADLVEHIGRSKKVCEHFHMPAQSGSDRILEEMNRNYSRAEFVALVDRIRQRVPAASITTDLIVGFPGETEEDFAETLELCERVRFDAAHTFMYSPRKGTPAAEFTDQVPVAVKKRRLQELMHLQNIISAECNAALLGSVQEILVEGPSAKNAERLAGRTRTNKLVSFAGDRALIGQLVPVRISKTHTWTLEGEII